MHTSVARRGADADSDVPQGDPLRAHRRARLLRASVSILFVVAALVFGIAAVLPRRAEFGAAFTSLGWRQLGTSAVLSLAGVILSARAWTSAMSAVGGRFDESAARKLFFATQVGKYLPGMAWPYVAQLRFARRFRIPRTTMLVGQGIFLCVHVATGALFAGILFPFVAYSQDLPTRYLWLVVPVVASIAFLHPTVLAAVLRSLARLRGATAMTPPLRGSAILRASAWMSLVWILYGGALATLVIPMAGSGMDIWLLSIAGFAAAWIIGFVVIIAPAGAGARELTLATTLAATLTPLQATAVALSSRIIMTMVDLLLGAISSITPGSRPTSEAGQEDEPTWTFSPTMGKAAADVT